MKKRHGHFQHDPLAPACPERRMRRGHRARRQAGPTRSTGASARDRQADGRPARVGTTAGWLPRWGTPWAGIGGEEVLLHLLGAGGGPRSRGAGLRRGSRCRRKSGHELKGSVRVSVMGRSRISMRLYRCRTATAKDWGVPHHDSLENGLAAQTGSRGLWHRGYQSSSTGSRLARSRARVHRVTVTKSIGSRGSHHGSCA